MIALLCVLAMLLLFSLSIFVHELGHFLAARSFGMIADVFSIGMGKAVWKRKMFGTTVQIGWLPIGGYVALPQMDPNSMLESKPEVRGQKSEAGSQNPDLGPPTSDLASSPSALRGLPPVAPWKKIIVAVSGAAGNILFAFFLATIVWVAGKPASLQEQNGVIGYIEADSPALTVGFQVGDEITAINETPVQNWQDILTLSALSDPREPLQVQVRTPGGETKSGMLQTEKTSMGIWMIPGLAGMDPCYVASILADSGADRAGIRPGDELVAYNGQEVYSRAHLSQLVEASAGAPGRLDIRRQAESLAVEVTASYHPELERWLIGITYNTISDLDFDSRIHPTPWAQVREHATAIFRFLDALTTPSTSRAAAGAAGGPIMILIMLWYMVKSSLILAIWFTGFLNVNLAIINLLPLPVLDGGHVVMNLWEWVTGKAPPPRLVNALANGFAVILLGLILLLSFRDTANFVWQPLRSWMAKDNIELPTPVAVDPQQEPDAP